MKTFEHQNRRYGVMEIPETSKINKFLASLDFDFFPIGYIATMSDYQIGRLTNIETVRELLSILEQNALTFTGASYLLEVE